MFGNILIIDDDEATVFLHKFFLEDWGICKEVYSAGHGKEAIELLEANPEILAEPNSVILLDINMPYMNGFEFLRAYKELPDTQKAACAFIMLTTEMSKAYEAEAETLQDVITGFLNKPLDQEELQEKSAPFIKELS